MHMGLMDLSLVQKRQGESPPEGELYIEDNYIVDDYFAEE